MMTLLPRRGRVPTALSHPSAAMGRSRRPGLPLLATLLLLGIVLPLSAASADPAGNPAAPSARPPALHTFQLPDQFGTNHHLAFPRPRPLLLLVGDRKGVEEVDAWLEPLKTRWGKSADIQGIADVRAVPRFLRDRIVAAIRKARPKPVMLDFDGSVLDALTCVRRTVNLFVVNPEGHVTAAVSGLPSPERLSAVEVALQPLLGKSNTGSAPPGP